jgi:hypothetical protein
MSINEEPRSNKPGNISFLSPPALLAGEDRRAYDDLHLRVFGAVMPSDLFEELWSHDIIDRTWQVLRWRRLQVALIALKMKEALVLLIYEPLKKSIMEKDNCEVLMYTREDAEELVQKWATGDQSAVKQVEELLSSVGHSMESAQSKALELGIDIINYINRWDMSAEARRNAALREIERHRDRKAFARALRDQVRQIEDEVKCDETKMIAPADAAEKNAA